MADRATQEEEIYARLRTRDRERKLLKNIELLHLLRRGIMGIVRRTGEPMVSSLLARQTGLLCIEAQERRERLQKLKENNF